MDQTLISFDFLDNKTHNTKGVKTVFFKQTGLDIGGRLPFRS